MKPIAFLPIFWLCVELGWGGEIAGSVKWRGGEDYSGAVVFAERVPKEPVHAARGTVILDQINLTFVPHVLPVILGATVSFPNSDEVRHNVFSPSPAKRFNLGIYPRGVVRQVTFDNAGEVVLLCNVHEEMSAYVLVLETPHFVSTRKDGSFLLQRLPPGKYTVTAWHEEFKTVTQAAEITRDETIRLNLNFTTPR